MQNTTEASGHTTDDQLLVSVEEAKQLLGGISTATIYRLFATGQLPSVRVGTAGPGGRRFCRKSDIDDYVRGLPE